MVVPAVISAVCKNLFNGLLNGIEQVCKHRAVANIVAGQRRGEHLMVRFIDDVQVQLAPGAPLTRSMLAHVPLTLTIDLQAVASMTTCTGLEGNVRGNVTASLRCRRHSMV